MTPLADFIERLEGAGFMIEVEDHSIERPIWRLALDDEDGGTCMWGIPIWIGGRWDIFLRTTCSAVHSDEWYRNFHTTLAKAIWLEDEAGSKIAESTYLKEGVRH
ncbi:hypothetical protein OVY48_07075 [Sphingobium sp. SA2]|jgi:hypothetical protein|uniref:hypothetical protein n=1 Tax=Sphingobium sp. SA2 TaxID=1524832 RepID=UPI0028C064C9|nr:hypothetical protein [Sphingobium sp. SA2]MDT7533197.1 hypothetical protein [Sphingobium sp. SA2]|tara:strand:+ start:1391 stop:1705 length:315 start_codon:yes stop_codon:yes gene_type:complete